MFYRILGTRLRNLRISKGLTQTTAALNCDNFRQWIGRLENGKSSGSIYNVYKYAASNEISFLQALTEAIHEFEEIKNPRQIVNDQKAIKEYLAVMKKKYNRI